MMTVAAYDDHTTDRSRLSMAVVPLGVARDSLEKELLLKTLNDVGNNISEIARRLRISRPTVYRLHKKHGLENLAPPWRYRLRGNARSSIAAGF